MRLPEATLGVSVASERAWRPLMRRWVLGTPEEREALEAQLATFAERHAGDPLVRLALVLRAFNALERGELERAEALVRGKGQGDLRSPLFGHPGATRDLATLVIGTVERRRGQHRAALRRLRPLLHKMLDGFATDLLDEELVHAAIGARSWLEAVTYMEVWQREAEPGHEREVSDRVKVLLTRVPRTALLRALDARAADGRVDSDRDTAQLIAQQLAVLVVSSRDAALARSLLDRYGELLGDYGEAVARLAVDTTRGRVRSRTVGLLVSLRNDGLRRRSADVVSGVSFGLGLPGSASRLVTRDGAQGDVRRAMTELASEGAAVIVAGVDPSHNGEIAAFSRDESLPVLLLTPDATGVAQSAPFVFLVGNEVAETVGLMARRLRDDGAAKVLSLGEPLSTARPAGVDAEASCSDPPPASELRGQGIDALVVVDGAHCGDPFLELVKASRARVALGLGVTSLRGELARAPRLAAGVFPVDVARPDARLAAWLEAGRSPPSWWSAIGRDAAVLAASAVENLAESGTDAGEVKARRVEAASALAAARASLWTTEAQGFGDGQRLERSIRVVGGP